MHAVGIAGAEQEILAASQMISAKRPLLVEHSFSPAQIGVEDEGRSDARREGEIVEPLRSEWRGGSPSNSTVHVPSFAMLCEEPGPALTSNLSVPSFRNVASQVPAGPGWGDPSLRANQPLRREMPEQFVDLAGEFFRIDVELQRDRSSSSARVAPAASASQRDAAVRFNS